VARLTAASGRRLTGKDVHHVPRGWRRDLHERTLEELPGYRGAQPVWIGNAGSAQFQLDIGGEVLDSLRMTERAGLPEIRQSDLMQLKIVEHLADVWNKPDAGMWESRGEPRQYTYSKAMAWVGIDCFLKGQAAANAEPKLVKRLTALRRQIHEEVCREAWHPGHETFIRYYGGDEPDASLLLLPLVDFLPIDDLGIAATIDAIGRELNDGGLIRRTKSNDEGVFIACSCWMADCLSTQGKHREAAVLFECVLDLRNDIGLLSEEYTWQDGISAAILSRR
jgi:GH15 family glucan-1,4-alpha-glucosidase